MIITQKTRLNMVIGFPLAHTKSPVLHNKLYQALKINAVLLAFPHKNVQALVQAIKTLSVELTAVTMPFKECILAYLDYCSPEVNVLGAVNTLIYRRDSLWGYNTDIEGFSYALRNICLTQKNTLLIGAGGAARAAAYALQKNAANLFWLNRTKERIIPLVDLFGGHVVDSKELQELPIDIIINATPVGMHPDIHATPLPGYRFKPEQTIFDMVYNPFITTLMHQAHEKGAHTISGLEMFIGQGVRQVELWQDKEIFNSLGLDPIIHWFSHNY